MHNRASLAICHYNFVAEKTLAQLNYEVLWQRVQYSKQFFRFQMAKSGIQLTCPVVPR
jgi:hypothetical protein